MNYVFASFMYFITLLHPYEKVLQILEIPDFRIFEKQLAEIFFEQINKLLNGF